MYKLLCSNLTKSHRSLTNFTGYYRKVAQKCDKCIVSSKYKVQSDIPNNQPLEDAEVEESMETQPSADNPKTCTPFFTVKQPTAGPSSVQAAFLHSTPVNHKKTGTISRKTFKNRQAEGYYWSAVDQCTQIKKKLERYHQQAVLNRPPRLLSDIKKALNIKDRRPSKPVIIKTKAVKDIMIKNEVSKSELNKIRDIKTMKPHYQFKQTNMKITYPTHRLRYKMGTEGYKMEHKVVSNAGAKTVYKDPVFEQIQTMKIQHTKVSEKEKARAREFRNRNQQKKIPVIADMLHVKYIEENSERDKQLRKFENAVIKLHPTVKKASASNKMAYNHLYNKLLKKSGLLYQGPNKITKKKEAGNKENTDTVKQEEPEKEPIRNAPYTQTIKEFFLTHPKPESENSREVVTKHPLSAKEQAPAETFSKHVKRVLSDKTEEFDINTVCIKANSSSNNTNTYGNYVAESEEKVKKFVEGFKKQSQEPQKKPEIETDPPKENTRKIANNNENAKSISKYLFKLKELRDQTSLDKPYLKKVEVNKRQEKTQKVEGSKIKDVVRKFEEKTEKSSSINKPQTPLEKSETKSKADGLAVRTAEKNADDKDKDQQIDIHLDKYNNKYRTRLVDNNPEVTRSESEDNMRRDKSPVLKPINLKSMKSENLHKKRRKKMAARNLPSTEPTTWENSNVNRMEKIMERYRVQSKFKVSLAELKRINRKKRRDREKKLLEEVKIQQKKLDDVLVEKHKLRKDRYKSALTELKPDPSKSDPDLSDRSLTLKEHQKVEEKKQPKAKQIIGDSLEKKEELTSHDKTVKLDKDTMSVKDLQEYAENLLIEQMARENLRENLEKENEKMLEDTKKLKDILEQFLTKEQEKKIKYITAPKKVELLDQKPNLQNSLKTSGKSTVSPEEKPKIMSRRDKDDKDKSGNMLLDKKADSQKQQQNTNNLQAKEKKNDYIEADVRMIDKLFSKIPKSNLEKEILERVPKAEQRAAGKVPTENEGLIKKIMDKSALNISEKQEHTLRKGLEKKAKGLEKDVDEMKNQKQLDKKQEHVLGESLEKKGERLEKRVNEGKQQKQLDKKHEHVLGESLEKKAKGLEKGVDEAKRQKQLDEKQEHTLGEILEKKAKHLEKGVDEVKHKKQLDKKAEYVLGESLKKKVKQLEKSIDEVKQQKVLDEKQEHALGESLEKKVKSLEKGIHEVKHQKVLVEKQEHALGGSLEKKAKGLEKGVDEIKHQKQLDEKQEHVLRQSSEKKAEPSGKSSERKQQKQLTSSRTKTGLTKTQKKLPAFAVSKFKKLSNEIIQNRKTIKAKENMEKEIITALNKVDKPQHENLTKLKNASNMLVKLVKKLDVLNAPSNDEEKYTSPNNRPTIRREKPPPIKDKQKRETPKTKKDIVLPPKHRNYPPKQYTKGKANLVKVKDAYINTALKTNKIVPKTVRTDSKVTLQGKALTEAQRADAKQAITKKEEPQWGTVKKDEPEKIKFLEDLENEEREKIIKKINSAWEQERNKTEQNKVALGNEVKECLKEESEIDKDRGIGLMNRRMYAKDYLQTADKSKTDVTADKALIEDAKEETDRPRLIINLRYKPLQPNISMEMLQPSVQPNDKTVKRTESESSRPPVNKEPPSSQFLDIDRIENLLNKYSDTKNIVADKVSDSRHSIDKNQPLKTTAIENDALKKIPDNAQKDVKWCFSGTKRGRIEHDCLKVNTKGLGQKNEALNVDKDKTPALHNVNKEMQQTADKSKASKIEEKKSVPAVYPTVVKQLSKKISKEQVKIVQAWKQPPLFEHLPVLNSEILAREIANKLEAQVQSIKAKAELIKKAMASASEIKINKKLTKPKTFKPVTPRRPVKKKELVKKSASEKFKASCFITRKQTDTIKPARLVKSSRKLNRRSSRFQKSDSKISMDKDPDSDKNIKKMLNAMKQADKELEEVLKSYEICKIPQTTPRKDNISKITRKAEITRSKAFDQAFKNDSKTFVQDDTARFSSKKGTAKGNGEPKLAGKEPDGTKKRPWTVDGSNKHIKVEEKSRNSDRLTKPSSRDGKTNDPTNNLKNAMSHTKKLPKDGKTNGKDNEKKPAGSAKDSKPSPKTSETLSLVYIKEPDTYNKQLDRKETRTAITCTAITDSLTTLKCDMTWEVSKDNFMDNLLLQEPGFKDIIANNVVRKWNDSTEFITTQREYPENNRPIVKREVNALLIQTNKEHKQLLPAIATAANQCKQLLPHKIPANKVVVSQTKSTSSKGKDKKLTSDGKHGDDSYEVSDNKIFIQTEGGKDMPGNKIVVTNNNRKTDECTKDVPKKTKGKVEKVAVIPGKRSHNVTVSKAVVMQVSMSTDISHDTTTLHNIKKTQHVSIIEHDREIWRKWTKKAKNEFNATERELQQGQAKRGKIKSESTGQLPQKKKRETRKSSVNIFVNPWKFTNTIIGKKYKLGNYAMKKKTKFMTSNAFSKDITRRFCEIHRYSLIALPKRGRHTDGPKPKKKGIGILQFFRGATISNIGNAAIGTLSMTSLFEYKLEKTNSTQDSSCQIRENKLPSRRGKSRAGRMTHSCKRIEFKFSKGIRQKQLTERKGRNPSLRPVFHSNKAVINKSEESVNTNDTLIKYSGYSWHGKELAKEEVMEEESKICGINQMTANKGKDQQVMSNNTNEKRTENVSIEIENKEKQEQNTEDAVPIDLHCDDKFRNIYLKKAYEKVKHALSIVKADKLTLMENGETEKSSSISRHKRKLSESELSENKSSLNSGRKKIKYLWCKDNFADVNENKDRKIKQSPPGKNLDSKPNRKKECRDAYKYITQKIKRLLLKHCNNKSEAAEEWDSLDKLKLKNPPQLRRETTEIETIYIRPTFQTKYAALKSKRLALCNSNFKSSRTKEANTRNNIRKIGKRRTYSDKIKVEEKQSEVFGMSFINRFLKQKVGELETAFSGDKHKVMPTTSQAEINELNSEKISQNADNPVGVLDLSGSPGNDESIKRQKLTSKDVSLQTEDTEYGLKREQASQTILNEDNTLQGTTSSNWTQSIDYKSKSTQVSSPKEDSNGAQIPQTKENKMEDSISHNSTSQTDNHQNNRQLLLDSSQNVFKHETLSHTDSLVPKNEGGIFGDTLFTTNKNHSKSRKFAVHPKNGTIADFFKRSIIPRVIEKQRRTLDMLLDKIENTSDNSPVKMRNHKNRSHLSISLQNGGQIIKNKTDISSGELFVQPQKEDSEILNRQKLIPQTIENHNFSITTDNRNTCSENEDIKKGLCKVTFIPHMAENQTSALKISILNHNRDKNRYLPVQKTNGDITNISQRITSSFSEYPIINADEQNKSRHFLFPSQNNEDILKHIRENERNLIINSDNRLASQIIESEDAVPRNLIMDTDTPNERINPHEALTKHRLTPQITDKIKSVADPFFQECKDRISKNSTLGYENDRSKSEHLLAQLQGCFKNVTEKNVTSQTAEYKRVFFDLIRTINKTNLTHKTADTSERKQVIEHRLRHVLNRDRKFSEQRTESLSRYAMLASVYSKSPEKSLFLMPRDENIDFSKQKLPPKNTDNEKDPSDLFIPIRKNENNISGPEMPILPRRKGTISSSQNHLEGISKIIANRTEFGDKITEQKARKTTDSKITSTPQKAQQDKQCNDDKGTISSSQNHLEGISKIIANQTKFGDKITEQKARKTTDSKITSTPHKASAQQDEQYNDIKNPVKAKIEEIFKRHYTEEEKIGKFNKNLIKHMKSSKKTPVKEEALPMKVPPKSTASNDGEKKQKMLEMKNFLVSELKKSSMLAKPDKDEQKSKNEDHIHIEKHLPNRYGERKELQTSQKPVSSFCERLCLPLKSISQVALKLPVEEATTLNKYCEQKILALPKTEQTISEKYKGLKISYMKFKRKQPDENFLPMILSMQNKESVLEKPYDPETVKKQILEFRYELLWKLHKEFSSLYAEDFRGNVGRFERVAKFYDSVTKNLSKSETDIIRVDRSKSMNELLGPCSRPSFERVARFYNLILQKSKKENKPEVRQETQLLVEKLPESLDTDRNKINESERILSKCEKRKTAEKRPDDSGRQS